MKFGSFHVGKAIHLHVVPLEEEVQAHQKRFPIIWNEMALRGLSRGIKENTGVIPL
jgi:hypothetical protein